MERAARPLNILIVEDEPLISMDIEMMVEDAGHHVIAIAAALDEVEALPDGKAPNVALVDMHLARGSTGLDVNSYVQVRWPNAIIVFVTANPQKIPQDFAGAHGVIAKPFSLAGFMSAVQYLEEVVCNPPPVSAPPGSFVASEAFAAFREAP